MSYLVDSPRAAVSRKARSCGSVATLHAVWNIFVLPGYQRWTMRLPELSKEKEVDIIFYFIWDGLGDL